MLPAFCSVFCRDDPTLLCMIYDIWWDPGSREANPWLVVLHNVFFCSTMLLLHWQCVWNQCNSEKWSWCISDAFQMVLHSWPMLFCVYNSIVNKIQKTTAWNAAPHLCWVFAGFVLILVSIFRYCSSAVDRVFFAYQFFFCAHLVPF